MANLHKKIARHENRKSMRGMGKEQPQKKQQQQQQQQLKSNNNNDWVTILPPRINLQIMKMVQKIETKTKHIQVQIQIQIHIHTFALAHSHTNIYTKSPLRGDWRIKFQIMKHTKWKSTLKKSCNVFSFLLLAKKKRTQKVSPNVCVCVSVCVGGWLFRIRFVCKTIKTERVVDVATLLLFSSLLFASLCSTPHPPFLFIHSK